MLAQVLVTVAHEVVAVQLLPDVAAEAVHVCTGTFEVLFVEQVVVVQLFPELGPDAVQVCTGTFVVLLFEQVVAV